MEARPAWRSRDVDEQTAFGRWLRDHIVDRVDTGRGTPDDSAAEIATWVIDILGRPQRQPEF
jgi:hypothetical protein